MLHSFTRNHNDLSTDSGFQFEFFCDCCGNGYKSTFQQASTYRARGKTDALGRGAGLLGGLFGGALGDLGNVVERGMDAVGSNLNDQSPQWRREHEQAFDAAQERCARPSGSAPSAILGCAATAGTRTRASA